MPRRLHQVADFALRHPEEMALGTAASIAARAQVQPSTVVRFAQALGYRGFSDLQSIFRASIRDRWPEPTERLRRLQSGDSDAPATDLDGFIAAAQSSLGRLHETMPAPDIGRAARLLSRARTVFVVGTRRSYPIVDYFGYAFATLGVPALALDSMSGLARERAALADREGCHPRHLLHALRAGHRRDLPARRSGGACRSSPLPTVPWRRSPRSRG